jgi:hypothetical protein
MAGALRVLRRLPPDTWLVLQATAPATAAWVIAKHVVGNHEPFFAPIAAAIGLNAARGERGRHAVRLLLGVVVGVIAGELRSRHWAGGTEAWRWPSSPPRRWRGRSAALAS